MLSPNIPRYFKQLTQQQLDIIAHESGPLLVIAGPGCAKTTTLVLRGLNLVLTDQAKPGKIAFCTFSNKAARQLRDRFTNAARAAGYLGNLSDLRITTIHALCGQILCEPHPDNLLGPDYETLDSLGQALFIQRHINDLSGQAERALLIRRWRTPQAVVHNLATRFNQIAEELIDPERLINSSNQIHSIIGAIYRDYHQLLHDHHKADFAHLQRGAYELLQTPTGKHATTFDIHHLLVDEYQDTSPIQEKLLLKITKPNGNITVVGDDD